MTITIKNKIILTAQDAFTLIQLLIALSLMVISLVIAIPNCYDLIARNRSSAVVNQLLSTLNYVRYEAISRGKLIVWCGSRNKNTCTGDWSEGQIILLDKQVLRVFDALEHGKLTWQGFDSNDYIKVSPTTLASTMAGRFTYIPNNGDEKYAREIIINRMGRGRVSEFKK